MNRHFLWLAAFGLAALATNVRAAETEADEAKEHAEARKNVEVAKISIKEAVELALKKLPNGKAVQVDLESDAKDGPEDVDWFVEVVDEGKHKIVEINAKTGEVEKVSDEKDDPADDDDEVAEDAAAKASVTLLQALETAMQRLPKGKPFEVSSVTRQKKTCFLVEFVGKEKIQKVAVDAATNEIIVGKKKAAAN